MNNESDFAGIVLLIMAWVANPIIGAAITIIIIAILLYNKSSEPAKYDPPEFTFGEDFSFKPEKPKPKPKPEQSIDQRLLPDWYYYKQDFMKSNLWNKQRKSTLKRDNYTCQQCKKTGISLDVHHITYAVALELQFPNQLISLCRNCHSELHKEEIDYTARYDLKKI